MTTPADYWRRCPVCRARTGDELRCGRCGMDFEPALRAAEEAHALIARSRSRLAGGDAPGAFEDGLRAVHLHARANALQQLAVTALAVGRFEVAVSAWRRYRAVTDGGGPDADTNSRT